MVTAVHVLNVYLQNNLCHYTTHMLVKLSQTGLEVALTLIQSESECSMGSFMNGVLKVVIFQSVLLCFSMHVMQVFVRVHTCAHLMISSCLALQFESQ